MAAIDAKLLLCSDKAVAASVTTDAIDLGKNGAVLVPLYVSVKLTEGCESGSMTSVKVQSASIAEFSDAVDEMTVQVPASVVQTRPCNLVQFFAPISPAKRFVRLVMTGSSPVGGKLWAYLSPDIQVPI